MSLLYNVPKTFRCSPARGGGMKKTKSQIITTIYHFSPQQPNSARHQHTTQRPRYHYNNLSTQLRRNILSANTRLSSLNAPCVVFNVTMLLTLAVLAFTAGVFLYLPFLLFSIFRWIFYNSTASRWMKFHHESEINFYAMESNKYHEGKMCNFLKP